MTDEPGEFSERIDLDEAPFEASDEVFPAPSDFGSFTDLKRPKRPRGRPRKDGLPPQPRSPEERAKNPQPNLPPAKLSHRHLYIAQLAALGKSNKQIAQHVGMSESRLSIVLSSDLMVEEITRLREELFDKLTVDQNISRITKKAVEIAEDAMTSEQTPTKLRTDIAFKFMDRSLGRPKQQIEVSGGAFKEMLDFFDQLDEKKRSRIEEDIIEISSRSENENENGNENENENPPASSPASLPDYSNVEELLNSWKEPEDE